MSENKSFGLLAGSALIGVGLLALVSNLVMQGLGLWSPHNVLRFWPLSVVGIGLGFCAVPLVVRGQRWLGALFIPGVIILYTGAILFFTSVTGWEGAWSWLWPQEVLGVAVAFLCAMVYTRCVWFGIPVILIGINGLVLQFCALTGLWEAWAVLWPIEPFAVGLVVLLVGAKVASTTVTKTGLGICAFSALAGLGMLGIMAHVWWYASTALAGLLVLAGGLLIAWALLGRRSAVHAPAASGQR